MAARTPYLPAAAASKIWSVRFFDVGVIVALARSELEFADMTLEHSKRYYNELTGEGREER